MDCGLGKKFVDWKKLKKTHPHPCDLSSWAGPSESCEVGRFPFFLGLHTFLFAALSSISSAFTPRHENALVTLVLQNL